MHPFDKNKGPGEMRGLFFAARTGILAVRI
jgi:hypothetical protein